MEAEREGPRRSAGAPGDGAAFGCRWGGAADLDDPPGRGREGGGVPMGRSPDDRWVALVLRTGPTGRAATAGDTPAPGVACSGVRAERRGEPAAVRGRAREACWERVPAVLCAAAAPLGATGGGGDMAASPSTRSLSATARGGGMVGAAARGFCRRGGASTGTVDDTVPARSPRLNACRRRASSAASSETAGVCSAALVSVSHAPSLAEGGRRRPRPGGGARATEPEGDSSARVCDQGDGGRCPERLPP